MLIFFLYFLLHNHLLHTFKHQVSPIKIFIDIRLFKNEIVSSFVFILEN